MTTNSRNNCNIWGNGTACNRTVTFSVKALLKWFVCNLCACASTWHGEEIERWSSNHPPPVRHCLLRTQAGSRRPPSRPGLRSTAIPSMYLPHLAVLLGFWVKPKFLCLKGKSLPLNHLSWDQLSLSSLAVSELPQFTRVSHSWQSSCLSFPHAEVTGMNSQPLAGRLSLLGNIRRNAGTIPVKASDD